MPEQVLNIGVLALQGAVSEHIKQLNALGVHAVEVKKVEQLTMLDALILPGGESTTMGRLMREYGFIPAIQAFAKQGKPIFGTCAGMILLAKRITSGEPSHLNLMDIEVERNVFGRQIDSFEVQLDVKYCLDKVPAVFIRAPCIKQVNADKVEVLANYQDKIVLVKEANLLACSFHPELTNDTQVLNLFIQMIKKPK